MKMLRLLSAAAIAASLFAAPTLLLAGDVYNVGPKEYNECHEAEYDVWKDTPHFESYKKVPRPNRRRRSSRLWA